MSENCFDVERLKEDIREEVENRRRESLSGTKLWSAGSTRPLGLIPEGSALSHIRSVISAADAESDVGLRVPPMMRFQGLKRRLALFVGRQVLYLSSFITEKQRSFNKMTVYALLEMSKLQERVLSSLAAGGERHGAGGVEARLEELERRISEQEDEIKELWERLERRTDDRDHRPGTGGEPV